MATKEQLIEALKAADAAGNTEDAAKFAKAIQAGKFDAPGTARPQKNVMEEWEQRPWYGKVGQSFDDAARLVASGLTAGYSDNIAGGLNQLTGLGDTDAAGEKALTEEARMRMGMMSTPYEILGALLPASKLSKAASIIPGAGGSGAASSAIREGIAGGTQAGLMTGSNVAAGTADVEDIPGDVGVGILGGAAGGAAGAKAGDALSWAGKKLGIKSPNFVDDVVPPKSVDGMKRVTDEAYGEVDALGTAYPLNDYSTMLQKMSKELDDVGIDFELHPKAAAMLNRLQNKGMGGGDMSPRDIDNLRRMVSRDVKGSGGEDHMAGIMKRYLDDFIETGPTTPGSTDASKVASDTLKFARDQSRRTHLMTDIEEQIFKGENAASDHGDINMLRNLLNNKTKRRQMSKEELDALVKVVRGDTAERILRKNASIPVTPVGAGVLATGATGNPLVGAAAGGSMMVIDPLMEAAARQYTNKNIQALMNTVGGGTTTKAASRQFGPRVGQAAGVLAVEEEKRKNKKRNKKR